MDEININNYLQKIKEVSENIGKNNIRNEMCDYSQHLEFHSKGFEVPHDVWQSAESAGGLYPIWDNPYSLTWDFNKKDWNIYFAKLIWRRRPGEDSQIKAYRANTWNPVTKVPISKAINILSKIQKAKDYRIDWSESEKYTNIPDGESLEDYICEYYPEYRSVENFVFTYLLRELIANDPNLLIGVKELPRESTDIPRPFAFIYNSSDQLYYKAGEIAIIKNDKGYTYQNKEGKYINATKYEVWTKNQILYAYKGEDSYIALEEYTINHNLGELPIWRPRGRIKYMLGSTPVCLSYIDEMLPSLDKAAGELSDLDAEIVQHIYSTMWYFEGSDCTFCNGTGYLVQEGKQLSCSKCEGKGVMKKNPYKDIVLKIPKNKALDGETAPTPPAGYIEKSTEIAKLMQERIKQLFSDSLNAVNLGFLSDVQLSQSGLAKRYDRDEAYDFIQPISNYIIETERNIIYFINELRYGNLANKKTRMKAMPYIKPPEQFEIESSNMIASEIKTLREGNIDSTIITEKEKQYAEKSFGENKSILAKIELQKIANPFPAMKVSEIHDSLLTGIITESDAVKSLYLNYFIEELNNEVEDFLDMSYEDKIGLINKKVEDKIRQKNISSVYKQAIKEKINFDNKGV